MANSYFTWDDFVEHFGREMRIAGEVYERMVASGLNNYCLCRFDFTFVSDKRGNLERLGEFIRSHYGYSLGNIKQSGRNLELNGVTTEFPVTEDHLMYWALDMYKRGYEFDSELEAYGAGHDPLHQVKRDLAKEQASRLFELGMQRYASGNLSGALMSWSDVLLINPADANAYYSRAIVKNELHTWKAALRDYDKALELAPDFVSALTNRGSLKNDNGDHAGAIEDYNTVIALPLADVDNIRMARAVPTFSEKNQLVAVLR